MSRGRPLALSDAQLALVMGAAKSVPPGDMRSRYLTCVADLLTGLDTITDIAVEAAVEAAVARLLTPIAS